MTKKFETFAQWVLIIATFAVLFTIFSMIEGRGQTIEQVRETSIRQCVADHYTAAIGVREATGHNDGKEVRAYLHSVKLDEGFAWCAAFVNYTLSQCGSITAQSGWSPAWFPPQRLVFSSRGFGLNDPGTLPQRGDVFGIYFPSKGRIAHVGFIDQWNATKVITVEGNTNNAGSREGDGVYRKIRLTKQIHAVSNWISL